MKKTKLSRPLAAALLTFTSASAETTGSPDAWKRFNDWSIGDVLFPNLYLHGVGGFSSGDPADLASGGHDTNRESFSGQAIEPSVSLRTEYIEAFSNYLFFQDSDGNWDGELEELFGKIVNIPGGFEIKGGQYLARFGAVNDKHLHAWNFVDAEIPNSRFLGDDGLVMRGVEVSWNIPLQIDPGLSAVATLGFGNTRPHGDHDDHDDHDDHGGGALFEGEEGSLSENVFNSRLMARYRFSDFHSITGGVSYAGGDNEFGRSTHIVGLDAEYLWRENGLEAGGRAFNLRNELIWRRVGASGGGMIDDHDDDHDDDDDDDDDDHGGAGGTNRGTYDELGFYTTATYTWSDRLDTSLRISWVEGVDDFGFDERFRVSPAVSYWFDDQRRVGVRAQYNYDHFSGGPEEHSLWFQFNVVLGSLNEVR